MGQVRGVQEKKRAQGATGYGIRRRVRYDTGNPSPIRLPLARQDEIATELSFDSSHTQITTWLLTPASTVLLTFCLGLKLDLVCYQAVHRFRPRPASDILPMTDPRLVWPRHPPPAPSFFTRR